jgi:hypothetical protein
MRSRTFLAIFAFVVSSLAGTYAASASNRPLQPPTSPCQIQGELFDTAAIRRVRAVLTDSGQISLNFAALRDTLGISGIRFQDVTVVSDTTMCRRALTAWKAFYPSYGSEEAQLAAQTTGGLLLRLAPNRYAFAVAIFHAWSGATFFVTDSSFVMVKPWM